MKKTILALCITFFICHSSFAQDKEKKGLFRSAALGAHLSNLNGLGINCNFMFSEYFGFDLMAGVKAPDAVEAAPFPYNKSNLNIRSIAEYKIILVTIGWYNGRFELPYTKTIVAANSVCFSVGVQDPYRYFSIEYGIAPDMPTEISVTKGISGGTVREKIVRTGNDPFNYLMIRVKFPLGKKKKAEKTKP